MCCLGCQAVAEAIVEERLEGYYKNRSEMPSRPDELIPEALQQMQLFDRAEVQASFVKKIGDEKTASLILEGIVCAACAWLSENHVQKIPGVMAFKVNYSTHRARLVWDEKLVKLSEVLRAITDIGYVAHPFDPNKQADLHKKTKQLMLRRLVVAGLGAMQAMMLAASIYLGAGENSDAGMYQFLRGLSWLVATPVVFYSAAIFFKSAWRDLKSKSLGMDVPVSLAIILAYGASVWSIFTGQGEIYFDSITMFVFFLLVGRFLELSARKKSGEAMDSMLRLTPAIATRKLSGHFAQNDFEEVAVIDLSIGDEVLIRPGGQVPADGVVTEGASTVNESMLTGESLPQFKKVGDKLIGGSSNFDSPLLMKIKSLGEDTVLSFILRLLDEAQLGKPKIAKLADKVAQYFVIFILLLALATFVYWWQKDASQALWILISVLVVTCPCALSLATPTAVTVACGKLSQNGILTTSSDALEKLAKVTDIVFDKTGTLTTGKISLESLDNFTSLPSNELISIACALEIKSEHPIAQALLVEKSSVRTAKSLVTKIGQGIEGKIGGKLYRIGTLGFVGKDIAHAVEMTEAKNNRIKVYLADEEKVLGCFIFSDSLRKSARQTVAELAKLHIVPHMFSGDQNTLAMSIAARLDIVDAQGDLLPADKLQELLKLQDEGAVVAMVGDGVNDAPILAGADVSIAMGQGASLAQVSSDIVLFSNHLLHLSDSVRVSKFMMRIIKQNISWAIIYNLVALPLAILGYVMPWMAAIGMSLSSLLVVLNALRIRNL